jgi:hypothetical protein
MKAPTKRIALYFTAMATMTLCVGCWNSTHCLRPLDTVCDDGLSSNGKDVGGCLCESGTAPYIGEGLMCDEYRDRCVECLTDADCNDENMVCENGRCVG